MQCCAARGAQSKSDLCWRLSGLAYQLPALFSPLGCTALARSSVDVSGVQRGNGGGVQMDHHSSLGGIRHLT